MASESSETKKLTLKQAKWLQLYIETGNATQSAISAYNLDPKRQYGVARAMGSENLAKLNVIELMEELNLSDHRLFTKLSDLLDAQKPISGLINSKDADEKTMDFIDVPDNQTQVKALDIALKLKGRYPKEGGTNIQVNVLNQVKEQQEKYDL